ncbi:MAG: hypothetical protein COA94_08110 [Rickettsiales bacterium]|nr:MAG: hypothetical protein COA94_08110 [Rickettsiales bacterium]
MIRLICNIYRSIVNMVNHDGVEHSGYMSFMVLVSIFPFFIFILALTSFLGASELGAKFIEFALENLPEQSIESIRARISELIKAPPQELMTLAIFGSIWTSSSFVECLRTILNRVYEIKSPPNYIFRRLLSIIQFLAISLVISLAMLVLLIIPIGLAKLPQFVLLAKGYGETLNLARYALVFLSLFLSVCSLYYIIPNTKLRFEEVVPGAFLTVILWTSSGYLLSKYIGHYHQLNVVYGSIGSIIITLIFFYIVNMIFIIGAEFNYLTRRGRKKSSIR